MNAQKEEEDKAAAFEGGVKQQTKHLPKGKTQYMSLIYYMIYSLIYIFLYVYMFYIHWVWFSCVSIGNKRNETNKRNEQKAKGISKRTEELMKSCRNENDRERQRESLCYTSGEYDCVCGCIRNWYKVKLRRRKKTKSCELSVLVFINILSTFSWELERIFKSENILWGSFFGVCDNI